MNTDGSPGRSGKKSRPRGRRVWAGIAVVFVVAVVILVGWGVWAAGSETASVTGRVTRGGVPVRGGSVTFVGPDGMAVSEAIRANGTYTISRIPPGPVKIGVTPGVDRGATERRGGRPLPPRTPADRYTDAETSGLTAVLTGGTNTHDIELP